MQPDLETVTLDHLAGDWRIYQLKYGHRFSLDDVLVAWTAARQRPQAQRVLDLGCGIGSVGLLTLYRLGPAAQLWGREAQSLSFELAQRTLQENDLAARVHLSLGDLREDWLGEQRFPLITGSPPYFPLDQATPSPHPQRAAARMELRGDVFDYCRRAAAHLEEEGRFVFVHVASDARPEEAIRAAGLSLVQRQEVLFRSHLPPTASLFVCALQGQRQDLQPFVVRGQDGQWTDEYLSMRAEMGTLMRRPV